MDWSHRSDEEDGDEAAPIEDTAPVEDSKERSRRRRRPRRGKRTTSDDAEGTENAAAQGEAAQNSLAEPTADEDDKPKKNSRPRRRGRRGGRRTRSADATATETATAADEDPTEAAVTSTDARRAPHGLFGRPSSDDTDTNATTDKTGKTGKTDTKTAAVSASEKENPQRSRRVSRRPKKDGGPDSRTDSRTGAQTSPEAPETKLQEANTGLASNGAKAAETFDADRADAEPRPSRSRRRPGKTDLEPASSRGDTGISAAATETLPETSSEADATTKSGRASKRRGWWQRR